MLVAGGEAGVCVRVGHGSTSAAESVSFFRVAGILQGGRSGTPSAIVHPYRCAGTNVYTVDEGKVLIVKLKQTVRRVLALHGCGSSCEFAGVGLRHSA